MEDLNNKYIGTSSNKLNKSSLIVAMICETINNNQDIKRLLYYQSLNPLSPLGKYYDGNKKSQPNIDFSLLEETSNSKQLIFDEIFNPLMTIEESNCVYISDIGGRLDDSVGSIGIEINIVVPYQRNKMMSLGEKRTHLIASKIADLFDMITVDKKLFPDYVSDLGNVQFELTDYSYGRVAQKSTMVCFNMQFEVSILTLRS